MSLCPFVVLCVCVCGKNSDHESCPLNKFYAHSTVELTADTMMYSRSLEITHLCDCNSIDIDYPHPHPLHPLVTTSVPSTSAPCRGHQYLFVPLQPGEDSVDKFLCINAGEAARVRATCVSWSLTLLSLNSIPRAMVRKPHFSNEGIIAHPCL